ncbi:site-specific tyrosine recombinase [Streptococcus dysgalactiae subsp. equisimilis]|uniref:site-specific tyrosine recombinase XerD n=1 Tax=Streptococcus dysgalactiae TaxID=1334 RepID=UPI0008070073|nr:site-specific tyrosine recombinase XerD [Streptococcus dysgalactiae]MBM6541053.1 site-specific tyrosine recombinase XerD [Streptococcus dysgalactiae subsp. equisimilis]OBY99699.1 site-specific tyrosine recombinase XerD [Streptococcus dysgalactiae subsp. equisimilis]OBZ03033.1 site-specific tyrosine recombinase XerD [Streptococcus dysgalactiae subsp. equisimilis]SQF68445.1 site-specific tyrosine recombinase [Streptococcus dysgalactiae subsp. equisimilis]SQF77361.1 site-specific tyrosine reco
MITYIEAFIASKTLSLNSQKAYQYDLQQFSQVVGERISQDKLSLYQNSLSAISPSAKKRKISTVNQFLYYLYQENHLSHYFRITDRTKIPTANKQDLALIDRDCFYQDTPLAAGQLIALLMLELGLTPSDLACIEVANLDLTFQVLRLQTAKGVRVLPLSHQLIPFLERQRNGKKRYLFEHQGQAFSRQWFFNQLKGFLESIGYKELTAQKLREQFILKEKSRGKSIMELSQFLGLKSPATLEKYYKS